MRSEQRDQQSHQSLAPFAALPMFTRRYAQHDCVFLFIHLLGRHVSRCHDKCYSKPSGCNSRMAKCLLSSTRWLQQTYSREQVWCVVLSCSMCFNTGTLGTLVARASSRVSRSHAPLSFLFVLRRRAEIFSWVARLAYLPPVLALLFSSAESVTMECLKMESPYLEHSVKAYILVEGR